MTQALWVGGLCGVLSVGCSNGPGGGAGSDGGTTGTGANGGDASGSSGGSTVTGANSEAGGSAGGTGAGAKSLVGTWDVMTTPIGGTGAVTTVTIGQNSLAVASPSFNLTATRTGNTLTFTDEQTIGRPANNEVLSATQTAATFDAGIIPFDLGGSWTMQIVPTGQGTVMTCTLTVSSTEIDGSCKKITDGFDFSFTTTKMTSAASSLGDFGGKWMNTWTYPGTGGGTFPCELDFIGNSITTCPAAATNHSPLTGITFTYDGANTASGAAQGWAEYSATRQ